MSTRPRAIRKGVVFSYIAEKRDQKWTRRKTVRETNIVEETVTVQYLHDALCFSVITSRMDQ
jgi:hypothetical protein